MKTHLLLDVSNLVYRVALSQPDDTDTDVGVAINKALLSLNKFYKKYNAHDVIVVFDSPKSWRKSWTSEKNEDRVTHKVYKAHRRKNLTQSKLAKLQAIDSQLNDLYEMFKVQTGLVVLKEPHLEADDLIAGYVAKFEHDKHIVVSADKDFIQLLSNGNVTLMDPLTEKPRDLAEWEHDAAYFMFEKCLRGDIGDNVQSAYPNLRSKKIKEAYTDEFTRTNIMNHTFVVESLDDEGKLQEHKYTTKDLFEENKLLMDLFYQPDYIKELMDESITKSIQDRGTFNYFSFLKFLGKHDLQAILKDVDKFVPLLSGKGRGNL